MKETLAELSRRLEVVETKVDGILTALRNFAGRKREALPDKVASKTAALFEAKTPEEIKKEVANLDLDTLCNIISKLTTSSPTSPTTSETQSS